ncbi:unnamed protein product [Larinioides sclopetarius]|uniref:Uncharacterized protein n=1 Tax=Larinioides sclopetarius TaxID=280406 RepID=A0AAV2BDD1_9ARAC
MEGINGSTIFIIGDSQVGKTTIARRIFENGDLDLVSSMDRATEYQVRIPQRQSPIKILEIRNSTFLTENEIRFDAERDVAIFCYAVNDPDSYQHVADTWIPLFRERGCDAMTMILIGNKKDLRRNPAVKRSLAERGLRPVHISRGSQLLFIYPSLDVFFESSINDFRDLDQIIKIINDTILNFTGY